MFNSLKSKLLQFNLGTKLFLGFLAIALVAVLSGVSGVFEITRLTKLNSVVLDDSVPFSYVAREAVVNAQTAVNAAKSLLLAREDFDGIESKAQEAFVNFQMRLDMILYGSNSSAFKNSASGKVHFGHSGHSHHKAHSVETPAGSPAVKKIVKKVAEEFGSFKGLFKQIKDIHYSLMYYDFQYKDESYNLVAFLSLMEAYIVGLEQSFLNSARSEDGPSRLVEVDDCAFLKWYSSYEIIDTETVEQLNLLKEAHLKSVLTANSISSRMSGEDTAISESERGSLLQDIAISFEEERALFGEAKQLINKEVSIYV